MGEITQTVENASFVIQIAGDNNIASIAVNVNALDGVPATEQAAVLAMARRRLAEMPMDALPDHGPFAGLMPYLRNAQFVGREADLLTLAAHLKGGERSATAAAATGLGGVGKTQLAAEFVHRYGQFFLGGAFWLSFADPQLVNSELARCGFEMQLPGYHALDQPAQVRLVRRAFENAIPRLLVFDNCEDEVLLRDYLPKSGGSRALITARREQWDATLPVIVQPIDVLSVAEGLALLHKLNPHLDERHAVDLEKIAHEVDGLPLALHLAGSYLNQYRNSLGKVLLEQGGYAGAKAAFERVLKIDEAALGPDHPNVATDVNNLGGVLLEQGHYARAKAAFKQALIIFERTLPTGHPNIRTVRNNLMLLALGDDRPRLMEAIGALMNTGDWDQAEKVMTDRQDDLFDSRVEHIFMQAVENPKAAPKQRDILQTHLDVLLACKRDGIAPTFAALRARQSPPDDK